jgi:carboxymethylenebutenolidase
MVRSFHPPGEPARQSAAALEPNPAPDRTRDESALPVTSSTRAAGAGSLCRRKRDDRPGGDAVEPTYTPDEQRLIDAWEGHLRCEFAERDAAATVATMAADNYVNHVPVMTGGRGRDEMLAFYGRHFIPKMPADTRLTPVCRTVGQGRVIDEMIFAFTHDVGMDWMLPGVAPTGRRVEVPLVVVVQLRDAQVVCERIYWDQASVLVQLGLLEPSRLPVAGAETARKVLDPGLPSNDLIRRSAANTGEASSAV